MRPLCIIESLDLMLEVFSIEGVILSSRLSFQWLRKEERAHAGASHISLLTMPSQGSGCSEEQKLRILGSKVQGRGLLSAQEEWKAGKPNEGQAEKGQLTMLRQGVGSSKAWKSRILGSKVKRGKL